MTGTTACRAPVPCSGNPDATPPERYPVTGDMVGVLRIEGVIASGGMAHVYKGVHTELEVVRAIKLLKPGYTNENRLRFQTEAKLAANLHHPNIVQIYSVGLWEDHLPYIEMEFVPGISLYDLLAQRKGVPLAVALAITRIVCAALAFAANQSFTVYGKSYLGLVHRDIKPANILLHDNGTVKLTDFGIALPQGVSLHTTSPGMLGTFPYASPEQLDNDTLDSRTDVYSLGCVLYEMITSEKAFPQKTLPELIRCKGGGCYKALKTLVPGVSVEVEECVARALMVDKEKRHPDVAAFARELDGVLDGMEFGAPEVVVRGWMADPDSLPFRMARPVKRPTTLVGTLLPYVLSLVALGVPMLGIIWAYTHYFAESPTVERSLPPHREVEQEERRHAPAPAAAAKQDELRPAISGDGGDRAAPAAAQRGAAQRDGGVREGLRAFERGEYAAAVRFLERGLESGEAVGRDSLRGVLRLFESHLEQGELDRAAVWVRNPIEDGHFYYLAGRYWLSRGDENRAEASFEKSLTSRSILGDESIQKGAWYRARLLDERSSIRPTIENRRQAARAWESYLERACRGGDDSQQRCVHARQRAALLRVDS